MKHFTRQFGGGGSTYDCDCCGRRTRYTGVQSMGSKLCPQCFDLAGIENDISDGHSTVEDNRAEATRLIAEIAAKGGDTTNVFAYDLSDPLVALDEAVADADASVAKMLKRAEKAAAKAMCDCGDGVKGHVPCVFRPYAKDGR